MCAIPLRQIPKTWIYQPGSFRSLARNSKRTKTLEVPDRVDLGPLRVLLYDVCVIWLCPLLWFDHVLRVDQLSLLGRLFAA